MALSLGAPSVGTIVMCVGACRGSSAGAFDVATLCRDLSRVESSADFLARGRFETARRNSLNTVVVCCLGVSVGRLQCVGYNLNVPEIWYPFVAGM